jgi:site-specific recombinase XerC
MSVPTLKIGLAGFGNVGAGVYKNLAKNRHLLRERTGYHLEVARVAVRDPAKARSVDLPEGIEAKLVAGKRGKKDGEGLYRWAETQNLYPAIARSVRGLPVRKDEPLGCLDRDAVAGLLTYADGKSLQALRDRALVHVMFSTGLRLVSLCGLDVAHLDAGDAVLAYCGKGDRDAARRAYLGPAALEALRCYLQARRDAAGADLDKAAPLFAALGNRAGGDRLTARSVRRVMVGLMEAAGHVHRDGAGKLTRPRVLSAHSLRRSAITCAFDAAGLDAAQTLAGHADPKTTRRAYARVQKGRVLRNLAGVLDLGTVGAT